MEWAFIDKGNQIARLATIVVKISFSVRSVRLSIVGQAGSAECN